MIELVVFDMAGTTVDEDNVVYKTVRAAINAAGYEFTQAQVQATGAGKEKSQAIRDVLALDGGPHDDDEVATIFADFKSRLKTAYEDLNVQEQPGASELFRALRARGIRVVLNTGYDRPTALKLIDKIGWNVGRDVDALVTASDVDRGRPYGDMIIKAMQELGIKSAEHVAKVGDSQIDIHEGQDAGCALCVGITTGAQTREQLAQAAPTEIIDRLMDLLPLVAKREQRP
ncbi:Phosphonoacetaldehyde hydrolase [Stieleria maiorica]|uniref:Phosphonoacetaldehyde hydrolase n=1 Tax=Stieleria maiorica TaxID=2795974 RepID=A0A5B9M8W4_9BACT|nr:phosphonatase-like hydrolase [Stieleria maiorica]QEF97103.1 Phosphonoacetaldehyde hydrolase [Stieleria maiorica]